MKRLNADLLKYIGIVIVIIVLGWIFLGNKKESSNTNQNAETNTNVTTTTNTGKTTQTNTTTTTTVKSSTAKCNFKITSPASGSSVTFPFSIKGQIDISGNTKYSCNWYQNQGLAGTVEVLYYLNGIGWRSAGLPTNIYTSGVNSTSTLTVTAPVNLYAKQTGIPSGAPVRFIFTELVTPTNPNSTPNSFELKVYLK